MPVVLGVLRVPPIALAVGIGGSGGAVLPVRTVVVDHGDVGCTVVVVIVVVGGGGSRGGGPGTGSWMRRASPRPVFAARSCSPGSCAAAGDDDCRTV